MISPAFNEHSHARYLRRLAALRPAARPNAFRREAPVEEWLGPELSAAARRWAAGPVEDRPWAIDDPTNTPGSRWCQLDPVATFLGRRLEGAVSDLAGERVRLSQGSLNVWSRGVPLVPHRDLFPDGHLVLIWTLLCDAPREWTLYLARPDGTDAYDSAVLDRGLLFASGDALHWRDPFPGSRAVTAILRYGAASRRLEEADYRRLERCGAEELRGVPPSGGAVSDCLSIIDRCRHRGLAQDGLHIERSWLAPRDIERLLASRGALSPARPSLILPPGAAPKLDASIRASDCRTARLSHPELDWLRARLARLVRAVAPEIGVHDRLAVPETAELLDYAPPQGRFVWHADAVRGEPTERRRVSVSVLLAEADEGGQMDFRLDHGPALLPGDAAVFRSLDVLHRVRPVVSGRRTSLVAWFERRP